MSVDTITQPPLRTRLSGPQDIAFLRLLFASRCEHLQALGLPEPALQALIDQQYACREADYARRFPEASTLVAMAGDEPVGAMVLDADAATLHIVDLVVAPVARGRGHGRALVLHAQARARETRREAVTLCVDPLNSLAVRLYLALGFEVIDQQPVQWRMLWRPGSCVAHGDAHAERLSISTTTKG